MRWLFFALQAAAPSQQIAPIDFDLRRVPAASDHGDVIVTGRRAERLKPPPTQADPILPRAEITLPGGLRGSIDVDSAAISAGMTSKRLMFTLKKRF